MEGEWPRLSDRVKETGDTQRRDFRASSIRMNTDTRLCQTQDSRAKTGRPSSKLIVGSDEKWVIQSEIARSRQKIPPAHMRA